MLAESWAIALAMGVADWCGYKIEKRTRVLLMPREDAERTTKVRLWQLARGAGLNSPHALNGWLSVDPHNPLDMGNAEHTKKLEAACDRFDLIIIDSFATSHHGDENSSRDMAAVMGTVRDISLGTDTSIGFIHHFNGKGGEGDKRSPIHRIRGSSAIAGYARHIVGVERGKEKGQVLISADGNFEFRPDPFVVALKKTKLPTGKQTLHYEHIGDAKQAQHEFEDRAIDAAILKVLTAEGWNDKTLRTLVNDEVKNNGSIPAGVRASRVSARASLLKSEGQIDREVTAPKRWRTV
jgi:RecA-family ATPase